MKHKIKIYSVRWPDAVNPDSFRFWYVGCEGRDCFWRPTTSTVWPDGGRRYARKTWDAALAVGLAHLRQECKHVQ